MITIGLTFKINGSTWEVTTAGIPDSWGITCLSTRAFTSASTEEILNYLK
jgi:hypothetical protein